MDDPRRLLACEEIRQLAHRHALALDSRDLDAPVALFVGDGERMFEQPRQREAA